jgi:hypothetical protein
MPDDYVIGAVMGDGLAGPRFAGRYRPSGHAVALEEIPHELLNRPDFVERLAISGRRAASLSSPHVVQVYDLVRVAHRLYLVTELCRGRTLAALTAAQPLPLRAALTVSDAVLAGLAAVHAAGLVHGDVRPEVVVVTPTGELRVAELGLAAVLAADPSMRGSPAVPPPEGGAPSASADLYAAACLLRDLVDAAKTEQGAVPEELTALIARAVSPTPAERLPEATALRRELETIALQLFGPEWRANADLAARVSRPIGPPPSRSAPREKGVVFPPPAARQAEPSAGAGLAAAAPVATVLRDPSDPLILPPPPPPSGALLSAKGGREAAAWPAQRQTPAGAKRPAEPALPWTARRRRRRRLAAVAFIVVVLAAVAAWVVIAEKPFGSPASAPRGLAVGAPIRLSVLPAATGGCHTTFTVVASGPLSGSGTLVYRWEESQNGSPATYEQYQLPISGDSSFRFTKELGFSGAATIRTSVTFEIVAPERRSASTTVSYVCAH